MSENHKPAWKSPWQWVGYVLPTLVALCLLFSPIGRLLELLSFDSLYLFRPSPDAALLSDVVILRMDEESRSALHQNPNRPWDRAVHARLLKELTARRAKVVVFDVLFEEPSPNPEADEQFAAAIREHGKVVLVASLQTTRDEGRPAASQLLVPARSLGTNIPWGVAEWETETGATAIIRKQFDHTDYTNLAWQAAAKFGKSPSDRLVTHWLNFYGAGGTLPAVSYHRALETNSLPPDFFADKAVFIGRASLITSDGQTQDRHATSYSRWHGGQPSGVEIQATAFLNLVNGDWLEKLPPVGEVLVLLFVGLLLGFSLPKFRPRTATVIAISGALLVAASAAGLAWGYHRWFAWLIVCAAQIPCALGWSILTYTQRLTEEKETLQRNVALAESVAALQAQHPPRIGGTRATDVSSSQQNAVSQAEVPPIPNHRLFRRVGRGSYGEVWLAQDEIGTYHAVKVVYQRNFNSSTPYEREFKGIQKFTPISRSHPGFVHILHVGRNDREGYFFYIMELGDDEHTGQKIDPATYSPISLAKKLEAGRLPLPECVQLGLELTAALTHLHQHQLVHRDIKPSNIIFVNRAPKFADVGLVTDIGPQGKDASLVGTEGYLAPEGPGTAAADIYSLGKVLYEACTGRDRHEFPSLSGTLIASANQQLTQFNNIILKACHTDKDHRYQAASQMHIDLLRLSQPLRV